MAGLPSLSLREPFRMGKVGYALLNTSIHSAQQALLVRVLYLYLGSEGDSTLHLRRLWPQLDPTRSANLANL